MMHSPGFKTDICPLHSKNDALSKMSLTSNTETFFLSFFFLSFFLPFFV